MSNPSTNSLASAPGLFAPDWLLQLTTALACVPTLTSLSLDAQSSPDSLGDASDLELSRAYAQGLLPPLSDFVGTGQVARIVGLDLIEREMSVLDATISTFFPQDVPAYRADSGFRAWFHAKLNDPGFYCRTARKEFSPAGSLDAWLDPAYIINLWQCWSKEQTA